MATQYTLNIYLDEHQEHTTLVHELFNALLDIDQSLLVPILERNNIKFELTEVEQTKLRLVQ